MRRERFKQRRWQYWWFNSQMVLFSDWRIEFGILYFFLHVSFPRLVSTIHWNVLNHYCQFIDKLELIILAESAKMENEFSVTCEVGLKKHFDPRLMTRVTQEVFFFDNDDGGTIEIESVTWVAKTGLNKLTKYFRCAKNCKPLSKITLPDVAVILKASLRGWTLSSGVYTEWSVFDSNILLTSFSDRML